MDETQISKLLKSCLSDQKEKEKNSFQFKTISDADRVTLLKNFKGADVDSLLVVGKCTDLINHDGINTIIDNFQCQFKKKIYYKQTYSNIYDGILVFSEVGHYKLGIPLLKKNKECENSIDESCLFEEYQRVIESAIKAEVSPMSNTINDVLTQLTYESKPFIRFKEELLSMFHMFDICLFGYGQKYPLKKIEESLLQISQTFYTEVAIGCEFNLESQFVSAGYMDEFKNFSYSNFLSNLSCNILIGDSFVAKSLIQKSFRACVYHCFQHDKSVLSNELPSFNISEFSSNLSVQENLKRIFEEKLREFFRLASKIQFKNLRIEGYFVVSQEEDFTRLLNSILNCFKKLRLVCTDELDLVHATTRQCRLIHEVYLQSISMPKTDLFLLFLVLYYKYLEYIFSSCRQTEKFMENNYGLFLQSSCFDKADNTFNKLFYEQSSQAAFANLLAHIFGDGEKNHLIRIYYLTKYYKSQKKYIALNAVQLKSFLIRLVKYFSGCLNKLTPEKARFTRYTVEKEEFLSIIGKKYPGNFVFNEFIADVMEIFAENYDLEQMFLNKIVESDKYFIFNNIVYSFQQGISLSNVPQDVGMLLTSLKKIVKQHDINKTISVWNAKEIPSNTENLFIFSVYNTLSIELSEFLEGFSRYLEIENFSMTYDPDLLARALYVTFPVQEDEDSFSLYYVLDMISVLTWLLEWIAYVVFSQNKNFMNHPKAMKARENFNIKINKGRLKKNQLSTNKLLICTGAFSISSRGSFYT